MYITHMYIVIVCVCVKEISGHMSVCVMLFGQAPIPLACVHTIIMIVKS